MMYLPLDKLLQETPVFSGSNQSAESESLQRQLEALKKELSQTNTRRREVR